jgi:magnesium-transporting ATPase (P-type)
LKETAIKMARKSNILTDSDMQGRYHAMSGDQFLDAVGEIEKVQLGNHEGLNYNALQNMSAFEDIARDLRVLYRAENVHKAALVVGLKALRIQQAEEYISKGKDEKTRTRLMHEESCKVCATGEGINDVQSIQEAQIGVAMNSGVAAAKAEAQLVLADDNFKSCL